MAPTFVLGTRPVSARHHRQCAINDGTGDGDADRATPGDGAGETAAAGFRLGMALGDALTAGFGLAIGLGDAAEVAAAARAGVDVDAAPGGAGVVHALAVITAAETKHSRTMVERNGLNICTSNRP